MTRYDTIGRTYAAHRRPDPRIEAQVRLAVGDVQSVVNVGAGTGSYEPADCRVVAVEPSAVMIAQRPPSAAPAVRAVAEALPFRDGTFDVSLAILALHHWTNQPRGLAECRRVARERIVILTWDPSHSGFWLVQDYFPEMMAADRPRFLSLEAISRLLGPLAIHTIQIPADCIDGFLGAYWRRPAAYLDPSIRGGISSFYDVAGNDPRLLRLARDLDSGAWERRYADLLGREQIDLGYRLLVAELAR